MNFSSPPRAGDVYAKAPELLLSPGHPHCESIGFPEASPVSENEKQPSKSLSKYYLLGRSGLRVSPLCLGTMTFGTDWGWGSEESAARQIFHRYLDAGGNFVDTADLYTGGKSEEMIGKFLQESGTRDRVVVATKFTFNAHPGDPNAGGNGRKHILEAVHGSLKRLQTDYIDLYWLHAWDTMTPAEEVMQTLDTLVRSGKVRYIGLSDVPAWYAARCQTLAEAHGRERLCALQLEYSLAMRNIEFEYVDAAQTLGMGICPWSPLASGLLSGKYRRGAEKDAGGRLAVTAGSGNPAFEKFSERNWAIVDELVAVAKELGRSPAQVALNWITRRPAVTSTIIGATKLGQLDDNLQALSFEIPAELSARLEAASRPTREFPYIFFDSHLQGMISGGTEVRREPEWFRE